MGVIVANRLHMPMILASILIRLKAQGESLKHLKGYGRRFKAERNPDLVVPPRGNSTTTG